MSSSSPGQESGEATSPEWGGRRADRTRATSAEGLVAGGLSYSVRTHLREGKVETRERSGKTGKDRGAATGAEMGIFRIKTKSGLIEICQPGGAAGRVQYGVNGEGCRCRSEIENNSFFVTGFT